MIGGYSSIVAFFVSNGSGNRGCATMIKKQKNDFTNCDIIVETMINTL